jgi:hypothetical protein
MGPPYLRTLSLASFNRTAIGPVVSILLRRTKPILFAKPLLGLYSPAVVEIKGNAKMLARSFPHIISRRSVRSNARRTQVGASKILAVWCFVPDSENCASRPQLPGVVWIMAWRPVLRLSH